MTNFDYYTFQINAVVEKINEEIDFFEKCEYAGCHPVNEYLAYLKHRIGADREEPATMMQYDNSGNKREIKKMNMDEYSKDLLVIIYKKPWNKLREIHKHNKIKEFINKLEHSKKIKPKNALKNRKYLVEEICVGLKNKRFGKNKSVVEYDQEKMEITSISSVWFNKKTGLYEIDWDQ